MAETHTKLLEPNDILELILKSDDDPNSILKLINTKCIGGWKNFAWFFMKLLHLNATPFLELRVGNLFQRTVPCTRAQQRTAAGMKSISEERNIPEKAHKCQNRLDKGESIDCTNQAIIKINNTEDAECSVIYSLQIDAETQKILDKFIDIYTLIFDMNFIIDQLREFSFLLHLADVMKLCCGLISEPTQLVLNKKQKSATVEQGFKLLSNCAHCVYISLGVLYKQRHLVGMIDSYTLELIVKSNMIKSYSCISNDLQLYLYELLEKRNFSTERKIYDDKNDLKIANVWAYTEYESVKVIEEIYNSAFTIWHYSADRSISRFNSEIEPIIKRIFQMCTHPVRMAYFAHYFTQQLLQCLCLNKEEQNYVFEWDWSKAMESVSEISMDKRFNRDETFFRLFISSGQSFQFIKQLKMALNKALVQRYKIMVGCDLTDTRSTGVAKSTNENASKQAVFFSNDNAELAQVQENLMYNATIRTDIDQVNNTAIPIELDKYLAKNDQSNKEECIHKGHTNLSQGNDTNHDANNVAILTDHDKICRAQNLAKHESSAAEFFEGTDCSTASTEDDECDQCNINKSNIISEMPKINKIMADLVILGKFLGYASNMLIDKSNNHNEVVITEEFEHDQSIILELFLPDFDVHAILSGAINIRKCFATIPWLVQYLVMQDRIHLKTEFLKNTTWMLFNMFQRIDEIEMTPICKLIVQLCVRWLISHNAMVWSMFCDYTFQMKVSAFQNPEEQLNLLLAELKDNPDLETLITNACPYIKHYRYSFMQVIPKIEMLETIQEPRDTKVQEKLIASFMKTLTNKTREKLKFITSEVYDSLCCDYNAGWPIKAKADMNNCYIFFKDIFQPNDMADVDKIDQRIALSIASFFPCDLPSLQKKTFFQIIRINVVNALNMRGWNVNVRNTKFDIKLPMEREFTLDDLKQITNILDYHDECGFLFRIAREQDEVPNYQQLVRTYLKKLLEASEQLQLPAIIYQEVATDILNLMQILIASMPHILTEDIINAACDFWRTDGLQRAVQVSEQMNTTYKITEPLSFEASPPGFFDGLLVLGFMEDLEDDRISFDKLKMLLVAMYKKRLMCMEYMYTCFQIILKYELCKTTSTRISEMLRGIVLDLSNYNNGASSDDYAKDLLFLDLLADFTADRDTL